MAIEALLQDQRFTSANYDFPNLLLAANQFDATRLSYTHSNLYPDPSTPLAFPYYDGAETSDECGMSNLSMAWWGRENPPILKAAKDNFGFTFYRYQTPILSALVRHMTVGVFSGPVSFPACP